MMLARSLFFLVIGITINGNSFSQSVSFDSYRVRLRASTPKKLDLNSHPDARRYRSTLRRGMRDGVNFAGHFAIVPFGCGAACMMAGIVNLTNGKVYFPDELLGLSQLNDWGADVQYRRNSTLLAVNGYKEGRLVTKKYYLWNGRAFQLLRLESQGSSLGQKRRFLSTRD